jgi:hypothetical protein
VDEVVRCAYGRGECSKSRYKVVVIQGTESSVQSGKTTLGEENVLAVLGFASGTNYFVSS